MEVITQNAVYFVVVLAIMVGLSMFFSLANSANDSIKSPLCISVLLFYLNDMITLASFMSEYLKALGSCIIFFFFSG